MKSLNKLTLTSSEARAIAIGAQGLSYTTGPEDIRSILTRLIAIQIDSINVLARAHEMVFLARTERESLSSLRSSLTGAIPFYFEYPLHAASLMSIDLWPFCKVRQRKIASKGWRGPVVNTSTVELVATALKDGPLTVSDLGKARLHGGGWAPASEVKVALEWLLWTGRAICVRRDGSWRRVYDLPGRVLPPTILNADLTDAECLSGLVRGALAALGVATVLDLADYLRQPAHLVDSALRTIDSCEVRVDAWNDPAWALNDSLDVDPVAVDPVPVSLFDSLLWTRDRTARIFGRQLTLEAYKPRMKRVFGYYTMPVLSGDRLIGIIDPVVTKEPGLDIRRVDVWDSDQVEQLGAAIARAASWRNCRSIRIHKTTPANLHTAVASAASEKICSGRTGCYG